MTIADNKSINVNFDIPVSVDQAWFFGSLIAFGAILVAVLFVRNRWAENQKRSWRLHEKRSLNTLSWFAVVLSPFWFALLLLTLKGTFSLWFNPPPVDNNSGDALAYRVHFLAIVGLMTALAGLIGTPLALLRVLTVERQTKAQEEGLITDRINKAIEGLGAEKTVKRYRDIHRYETDNDGNYVFDPDGNPVIAVRADGEPIVRRELIEETVPNLEVRIGAIYALERIAILNIDEHIQIMEILCAYVRENAPLKQASQPLEVEGTPVVRGDIQTALTVLGRRPKRNIDTEIQRKFRLDLRKTQLSGADFTRGNFSATQFHDCSLQGCRFDLANLEGSQFFMANLNWSSFRRALLNGVRFDHAIYTESNVLNVPRPNDQETIFLNAADFSSMFIRDEQLKQYFGTSDTKLRGRVFNAQAILDLEYKMNDAKRDGDKVLLGQALAELSALPDGHWSPYTASDLATHEYAQKFAKERGLNSWPHSSH
ncbi:pentapeptide repeat-containing protein [Ahrensia marina]|uniref:pentapeptide repeat-containing protein n=1 Tax=Ahrensia marina TaxID=1514904 RepID=UPI0006B5F6A0|nr:pentapeptide repeat-containing protein [Ahrensia marina]